MTLTSRTRMAALLLALVLAGGMIFFLAVKWPFTPEHFSRSLAQGAGSRVTIRNCEMVFFPSPGLLASGVELRRGARDAPPLATVRRVRVTGSWIALLTMQHRLARMEAEGLVIALPKEIPPREPTGNSKPTKTTIVSVILDGAVLQTASGLRFQFDRLRLHDAGPGEPIGFDAVLENPSPRGRITAHGSLGPWNSADIRSIRTSGSFELAGADLNQYKNLAGILTGKGKVSGMLSRMQVDGAASVSGFEVNHSGHPVGVQATYSAVVNGINGDTTLTSVNGRFLDTELSARGDVKGVEGRDGKTVELDFSSEKARIQDLLLLATKAPQPALSGPMTLRAHVVLPPEDAPFLRKVQLNGDFRIQRARFNKPSMQGKLEQLSARADKEAEPARVSSQLSGGVKLMQGVAHLHDCRFAVPGAVATGGGTYDVITKQVNLSGTVEMKATVSEASSGLKAILLKPFNAAFRNRHDNAGAELPVHVTGRYPNPQFHVNLVGKKRRR